MATITLRPSDIEIGERHRALSEDAVDRLAASMAEIGLRHPITVRIVDEMVLDGHLTAGVPVLAAGAHRLAAAKKLGWDAIECIEIGGDEIVAELWELAENLHRLDLTKEQRDEHIRRYAELLQLRQNVAIESKREDGRGHRPKGVAREIAEETGISVRTVQRALNPKPAPAPTPARKPAPVETALDTNHEREARRSRAVTAWNSLDDEDRAWFCTWLAEQA